MRSLLLASVLCLSSCATFDGWMDEPVTPAEGSTEDHTRGDVIEDSGLAESAGSVLSSFTGNPLLGASLTAALLGVLAASRRRRKNT